MYIEKTKLIVPISLGMSFTNEHDKIECYQGRKAIENLGISVHGKGTWAKGKLEGDITTYDYKALYQVYNLPENESADYWFIKYRHDTSHSELKKTFENQKTNTSHYKVDFEIEGNDYDINSVYITFEVIRLVVNGETRDFVVSNAQSTTPVTPDGNNYPGGFKAV